MRITYNKILVFLFGIILILGFLCLDIYNKTNIPDKTSVKNTCEKGKYLFIHRSWTDCLFVNDRVAVRMKNKDAADLIRNGDILVLKWQKYQSTELFACNKAKVCVMAEK